MSDQFDKMDKGDFDVSISKANQCIAARDFNCADTHLRAARKLANDSKSKSTLKRAEDASLAEKERIREEERVIAQRQRELEEQEAQLLQAEQRARDADRQAQAEADERENLNNRIAAAGNVYSQTIRAQANVRAAEQARNRQFEKQQAEAARTVANDQRRLAQERSQIESQRQQQQRQAETQRIQLVQAQQETQRAQAVAAETRRTSESKPVREAAPATAAATTTTQKKSNSINTGRDAIRCVSVAREKEDVAFSNTCNIQIFVVWCGDLKYSNKHCGDGPTGNSFYTHSINVMPGDKQYARAIDNYHYAACEGGISFGKDEIQDRADGTFTCVPK